MRRFTSPLLIASALVLAACVTINVYFPAAEAEKAAAEFVEKVIGDDPAGLSTPPPKPPQASSQRRFNLMSPVISDAQAQEVDITIDTPAIRTIRDRMGASCTNKRHRRTSTAARWVSATMASSSSAKRARFP